MRDLRGSQIYVHRCQTCGHLQLSSIFISWYDEKFKCERCNGTTGYQLGELVFVDYEEE